MEINNEVFELEVTAKNYENTLAALDALIKDDPAIDSVQGQLAEFLVRKIEIYEKKAITQ